MAMQMVSEVMTRNVRFVSPQEDVQHAAQMMGELDVGVLPVCDGDRLIGMVTDRDITLRSTAAGKLPQESHVEEVMSKEVRWCFEDQPLDEVMIQMADSQIRRVPVVTHDDEHRLIGIVALGDIATRTGAGPQKADIEQVVVRVSSPSDSAQGQQAAGGKGTGSSTGAATGGAGAEGSDADAKYTGQADAGDTSFDEGAEDANKSNAATGAAAAIGNVSLADGTGADENMDTDVKGAGQEAGSMSPAEAGQAISGGGDNAVAAGGASLADGTRSARDSAAGAAADKT
jgi:CBS domain-containing protein